jgi:hypothetical protein
MVALLPTLIRVAFFQGNGSVPSHHSLSVRTEGMIGWRHNTGAHIIMAWDFHRERNFWSNPSIRSAGDSDCFGISCDVSNRTPLSPASIVKSTKPHMTCTSASQYFQILICFYDYRKHALISGFAGIRKDHNIGTPTSNTSLPQFLKSRLKNSRLAKCSKNTPKCHLRKK